MQQVASVCTLCGNGPHIWDMKGKSISLQNFVSELDFNYFEENEKTYFATPALLKRFDIIFQGID
jgi:hypothetical protein